MRQFIPLKFAQGTLVEHTMSLMRSSDRNAFASHMLQVSDQKVTIPPRCPLLSSGPNVI